MTDPQRVKRTDPGRPEYCNVFSLHTYLTDEALIPDIDRKCRNAERGCVECKAILADQIAERFAGFRERAAELRAHPERVVEALESGAARARAVARETMDEVRHNVGMVWREVSPSRIG
jgi:tryptophanyl-tRNA synthetase